MYIDKLGDVINRYNYIYPTTLKMKNQVRIYIETMMKILNFKLMTMQLTSNYNNNFAKGYTSN